LSEDERDLPIPEAVEMANELLALSPFASVFFKFTCERCGNRLTFDVPNVLFKRGSCDKCGHITEIKKVGFMAVFGATARQLNTLLNEVRRSKSG